MPVRLHGLGKKSRKLGALKGVRIPLIPPLILTKMSEQVAKTLTEEPIQFEIRPRRAGLMKVLERLRILKKTRSFSIYPATLGMLEEMAANGEKVNIGDISGIGEAISSASKNGLHVCRFLAVAILRDKGPIAKVRVEILARFLHQNLTSKSLASLVDVVIKQTDIAFFLSIMKSIENKDGKEKSGKSTTPPGASQAEP